MWMHHMPKLSLRVRVRVRVKGVRALMHGSVQSILMAHVPHKMVPLYGSSKQTDNSVPERQAVSKRL